MPRLILFLIFLVALANLTSAQEAEMPGILRPVDQAVLETEEISIIVRGGELWLDGKSLKAQPTPVTRQALTIRAPAGRHELIWKSGSAFQKIQFFVATPGHTAVPPGWKVYRAHPPQAECQNCHAGTQPGVFKKKTLAETCFTCHEQRVFAAGHAHNDEVLAECVLCHNPHGSTAKFHLKMTRETACKQCHG
jgi:predicted CXXCH cytochrome family protein